MRLHVSHTTRYSYSAPVKHGLHRLRIKPKSTHGQTIVEWDMELTGANQEVAYEDEHHNATNLVTLEPGTEQLIVRCSGIVDTSDNSGVIGQHAGHMPLWCFLRATPLTRPGNRVRALAAQFDRDTDRQVEELHRLSAAVLSEVPYAKGETSVDTTAEQALMAGQGVCQDHAHVFIAVCRALDIPARYISGYLLLDDRVQQEAGHAWAEAHVAGLGWVGFDISNEICPDERYVRVSTGCDYSEAAPITGLVTGASQTALNVELAVAQQQIAQ